MIGIPLNKILFMDIETVGLYPDFKTLEKNDKELSFQFKHYLDWFEKRFPEDKAKGIEHMFESKSALVPEFAKIVVVSFAFVDNQGEIRRQTFADNDEKKLLLDCQKLLDKCGDLGFHLCGHNVKMFDMPMMAKRMVINGIRPSKLLPAYNTKPWDIKALDTKELWQFGSFTTIGSLELMCVCMGVESSKTMEVTGDKVHKAYWKENKLKEIAEYCEKDVDVLMKVVFKMNELV